LAAVLGTIAFIMLATSTIGYSPLYLLLNINTHGKK